MVYRAAVTVGRVLFRLLGVRLVVRGAEHLPAHGGAVLAVTHFGYLDFALLEWVVWRRTRRLVRFLVMEAAFAHRVAGPLLRAMRHLPVDRRHGVAGYRSALAAARAGDVVGVFPEGRVSRSWTLLPLYPGAAGIAHETGVPLVPVVVWGGHRLLTRGWSPSLRQAWRADVHVVVGAPVPLAEDPYATTRRLCTVLTETVATAQAGYPVTGGPVSVGPGGWWQPEHLGGGAPTAEAVWSEDLLTGLAVGPREHPTRRPRAAQEQP